MLRKVGRLCVGDCVTYEGKEEGIGGCRVPVPKGSGDGMICTCIYGKLFKGRVMATKPTPSTNIRECNSYPPIAEHEQLL